MDIQKEINSKQSSILGYKSYLRETDYHVIKEAEGDYSVPQEILDARDFARTKINLLEEEIEQLEEELRNHMEVIDEIEQLEDALESISAEGEELLN